jgi:hypothetical protein
MNAPMEAKKSPEVKPWVHRVVEAAGVFMPTNADGERRLGWWGVEMARFLKFCKTLPAETALRSAMEGYGRYLKSSAPPPQDWSLIRRGRRCAASRRGRRTGTSPHRVRKGGWRWAFG